MTSFIFGFLHVHFLKFPPDPVFAFCLPFVPWFQANGQDFMLKYVSNNAMPNKIYYFVLCFVCHHYSHASSKWKVCLGSCLMFIFQLILIIWPGPSLSITFKYCISQPFYHSIRGACIQKVSAITLVLRDSTLVLGLVEKGFGSGL